MTRRILIATQCFPPQIGGIQTLMAALAASLPGLGYAVEVFADAPGAAGDGADGIALRRTGGFKALRRRLKGWRVTRAAARSPAPALLIADTWKSLEHLGRLPAATRVLCLAHGVELPAAPGPRKARRVRRGLARADAVAANSRFTATLAAPFAAAGSVVVVHPGVTPPAPAEAAEVAAMTERLAAEGPVLATLARLEPRKGIDMTLRALPGLLSAHPGLTYAIAGDGADGERLRALALELGLDAHVRFLGRVSEAEKAALLTLSDIFVMPSRREGASVEGFGIVYLEAGSFRVPSVGGFGGGAEDAVIDGETGLLCDPQDPSAVAAALARLLEDPGLRARLGDGAATRAESLAWPAPAARYLEVAGLPAPA